MHPDDHHAMSGQIVCRHDDTSCCPQPMSADWTWQAQTELVNQLTLISGLHMSASAQSTSLLQGFSLIWIFAVTC